MPSSHNFCLPISPYARRVYEPAFSHDKAKHIMREGRGTHFDHDILDAVLEVEEQVRAIAGQYRDDDTD